MRCPWPSTCLRAAILFALLAGLAACSAAPRHPAMTTGPRQVAERHPTGPVSEGGRPELSPGTIIKLPEAKVVSFEEMMRDLKGVRIIYLGESHDNLAHHRGQLRVIEALQARGRPVAIGMEMFQRPFQPVLDAWVAGEIDEKEFLRRSDWYERWSMDFSLYQPILEHARSHGKPILALNATDELVRAVGSKGIAGLTEEQAAQLPEVYLGRSEHRHFIEHLYQAHGTMHHRNSFEQFYEAQRVWDETMAEAIGDYLRGPGAAQYVAVIVGNGHIEYGLGIPDDVLRRTGAPYRIISFQEAGRVSWEPGPGPPTPMFDYGRPLADYVWVTEESEVEARPKLGVTVGEKAEGEAGVKIDTVAPGSPAAKAGLKSGDLILSVDGEETETLGDLRYALSRRKMGEQVGVEFMRGGKREAVRLTLSPLPKMDMPKR